MKKLALIATVAAIALPAGAYAAAYKNTNDSQKWYDGATTINFTVQNGDMYTGEPFVPAKGERMTLDLVKGGQLQLDGEAAYIISPNGNKFLANNAPHETTAGITYQTEDGLVLYALPEAKTYTMRADVQDQDNDGYADNVDLSVQ